MSSAKKATVFLSVLILCAMALFLSDPARYAASVSRGISLWAVNVLPATFPFLFFTAILTGLPAYSAFARRLARPLGKFFGVTGAGGCAALLAALSGYPVGARMTLDLYNGGSLPREETFRLACIATVSGPVFLVGTVGGIMYQSAAAGWAMFCSHLAGAWLPFLCFRRKRRGVSPLPRGGKTDPALLYNSLYGSVISVLCVGGAIAIFSCFEEMLAAVGLFRLLPPPYAEGIVRGLLEMTGGCAALSACKTPLSCACSCALVTFGGLCVLCQQAAFLTRAGVKMLPFAGVKLLQAAVAFLLCWGICAAVM